MAFFKATWIPKLLAGAKCTIGFWMSLAAEVDQLRLRVAELTEEQESQRAEIDRLRRAIAGLRAGAAVPPSPSRSCYAASEDSYSLVESEAAGGPVSEDSRGAAPITTRSPSLGSATSGAGTCPDPLNWREREEVCDSIAAWITRCLRGTNRGSSGRDRNPLASRVWLVIRDYDGILYDPPLYFKAFHLAKPYVKRGTCVGDSIFIGLPTEREAVRVVGVAGLSWSGIVQR